MWANFYLYIQTYLLFCCFCTITKNENIYHFSNHVSRNLHLRTWISDSLISCLHQQCRLYVPKGFVENQHQPITTTNSRLIRTFLNSTIWLLIMCLLHHLLHLPALKFHNPSSLLKIVHWAQIVSVYPLHRI